MWHFQIHLRSSSIDHKLVQFDHPGECGAKKDSLWRHWLAFISVCSLSWLVDKLTMLSVVCQLQCKLLCKFGWAITLSLKGLLSQQFYCFLVKTVVKLWPRTNLFKTRNTSATTEGRYQDKFLQGRTNQCLIWWRYFPLTVTKLLCEMGSLFADYHWSKHIYWLFTFYKNFVTAPL